VRYRFPIQKIILAVSLVLTFGCTKIKSTDIGADLLPAIDNITTFDTTFEVVASTFLTPDSLLPKLGRDVNGNIGQFVLGHISNDPQFGKTTASIFFEVKRTIGYGHIIESFAFISISIYLCIRVQRLRPQPLVGVWPAPPHQPEAARDAAHGPAAEQQLRPVTGPRAPPAPRPTPARVPDASRPARGLRRSTLAGRVGLLRSGACL
jgi:hypothetical protein